MDDEFTERLCEEVRRHPHLYNSSARGYKDSQRSHDSWEKIAQALGKEESVCRQKWKDVRDRYVRARKKLKGRSSTTCLTVSVNPIIPLLSWLSDFVKHRDIGSNMSEEAEEHSVAVTLLPETIDTGYKQDSSTSPGNSTSAPLLTAAPQSPLNPSSSASSSVPFSSTTSQKGKHYHAPVEDSILNRLQQTDSKFAERLCEVVRRYPHLYNTSLQCYKDNKMCSDSWREISQTLGKEESVCQHKWKDLRDRYMKATKQRKGRSSPTGRSVSFHPIIPLLSWLSNFVEDSNISEKAEEHSVTVTLLPETVDAGNTQDSSASPGSSTSTQLSTGAPQSPLSPCSSASSLFSSPASQKRKHHPTPVEDTVFHGLQQTDTEFEERLCEEVRRHPHLYNTSSKYYKDSIVSHSTWREIAQTLGKDESVCRQRWKCVRDRYVRTRKRLKVRGRRCEAGENVSATPIIPYLSWLSDFVKHRKTDFSVPEEVEEHSVTVTLPLETVNTGGAQDSSTSSPLPTAAPESPLSPSSSASIPFSSSTSEKGKYYPRLVEDPFLRRLQQSDARFIERLCEEVRRHPHLYNKSSKYYKDSQRSHDSWEEIAQALGKEESVCRQKWKDVRDRYVRARKKLKGKGGARGGAVSVNPIIPLLSWLSDFVKHRKTDSNVQEKVEEHSVTVTLPLKTINTGGAQDSSTSTALPTAAPESPLSPSSSASALFFSTTSQKRKHHPTHIDDAILHQPQQTDEANQMEEHRFSMMVTDMLAKLSACERKEAQFEIYQLLYQKQKKVSEKDSHLPLSSLRLLVPPLRLMSACMWQISQEKNVDQYGKLAEFITLVTEMVPELLDYKQRTQLILGLRAQLILDLLKKMYTVDCKVLQDHLISFQQRTTNHIHEEDDSGEVEISKSAFVELVQTLLGSESEREVFFKEVFPVQYGARFDTALQILVWEFFSRLEEFLPVPSFSQVFTMFDLSSLDYNFHEFVSDQEDLKRILQHQQERQKITKSDFPFTSDTILSLLAFKQPFVASDQKTLRGGVDCKHNGEKSQGGNQEASEAKTLQQENSHSMEDLCKTDEETDDSSVQTNPNSRLEYGLSPLSSSPCSEDAGAAGDSAGEAGFQPPRCSENLVEDGKEHLDLSRNEEEESTIQSSAGGKARVSFLFSENTCLECGETFTSHSSSNHHFVYSLAQPFKCTKCDNTYKNHKDLKQHLLLHSGVMFNSFVCSLCNKRFSCQSSLKVHQRHHSGERPFACSYCNKRFLTKPVLKSHVRIHTGERPYACTICDRKFTQVYPLTVHLRMHRNERPYLCSTCGMSFCSSGALLVHTRKHTGERPHQCDFCGKRFATAINLTLHRRYHTGERPHPCSQCDKSFHCSSGLKKHMRTHTGEKPFKCLTCHKTFSQRFNMKIHLKVHKNL